MIFVNIWNWYEAHIFWWHLSGIIGWVIFLITAIIFEKRRYHFLWACYYALLFIFDFFAGFLALVGSLIWLGWHLWEYYDDEILYLPKKLWKFLHRNKIKKFKNLDKVFNKLNLKYKDKFKKARKI